MTIDHTSTWLLGIIGGLLLVVLWRLDTLYVRRSDCSASRSQICAELSAQTSRTFVPRIDCEAIHADQDRDNRMMFRMVRALVLHSAMSPAEKERVLNDRDTGSES